MRKTLNISGKRPTFENRMQLSPKLFYALVSVVVLLQSAALFGGIMEPDGALYAGIAKTMVLKSDWINLYAKGTDWLDKPHLPFWLAAASFRVFGITAFAYKFPSFLAFLLGLFYTYKTGKEIYGVKTAQLATLISATALHVVISNFDVRAEAYLTAFVIAAIYHVYRADTPKWNAHLIAAAFFSALAIMTKGIFILVPILGGYFLYWIFSGRWAAFINPKWWLTLLLSFLFVSPELICLYLQFDAHPEKVVFGQTGISGLRFFFWDSQFGRFFNNGPIKGKGDISFFIHTTAWAFLPWSLFLFAAIIRHFSHFKQLHFGHKKMVVYGGAGLTFLMFSVSKFQLPHYIIILFPLFAMIVADYLLSLPKKPLRIFAGVQLAVVLMGIALLAVIGFYADFKGMLLCEALLLMLILAPVFAWIKFRAGSIVLTSLCFFVATGLFLNLFFYPALVNYQGGKQAGEWLQKHKPAAQVFMYNTDSYTLDFYAPGLVRWISSPQEILKTAKPGDVVYLPAAALPEVEREFKLKVLKKFKHYHITRLKPQFINAKTRRQTLEDFVLVSIGAKSVP